MLPLALVCASVLPSVCSRAGQTQAVAGGTSESAPISRWATPAVEQVLPGVWRVRFGTPERFTPVAVRESGPRVQGFQLLPSPTPLPFGLSQIRCRIARSRTTVYVPCEESGEQIYGFGLDPGVYQQKGLRKNLMVCATALGETGASHGPVPLYLSTRGYGVYVDSARVPVVQVARLRPNHSAPANEDGSRPLLASEPEGCALQPTQRQTQVIFDLPGNSEGVEVFVFGGPTMREAVERYNLFSGGGAVPPWWGLGLKFRTYARANQATVLETARALRAMRIPCDMLGLEPGWQSHAYSCSFAWSKERFPEPGKMVQELQRAGFKLNLWEHAYVHPNSPLFARLKSRAGDSLV